MDEVRTCIKCGETKTVINFPKRKLTCKQCKDKATFKTCTICKKIKNIIDFPVRKSICKECWKEDIKNKSFINGAYKFKTCTNCKIEKYIEDFSKIYKLYLYALKYCYDDKPDLKDNP
jgi:hypothetical protein